MHTATRRVSRKAKGSRSLKDVDRLMRLLPFICPFKSSDLKASLLLLGYLLMTFVCDVMIRVSFEVSFPHLYVLEVWQSRMRLCIKRFYFHVCALFFSSSSSSLSRSQKKKKKKKRDTFLKTLFWVFSIL